MPRFALLALPLALACSSCGGATEETPAPTVTPTTTPTEAPPAEDVSAAPAPSEGRAVAVFAGGCFWCMERPFEEIAGVESVLSGYAGGDDENAPTYRGVSSGGTGHTEAVRVLYDPELVTYERLLEVFWRNIDPLDEGGQFCDRGSQYRTAIFPQDDAQRTAAEASREAIAEQLGRAVVTQLESAATFWIAEGYHQDFYRTNPARYTSYRRGCGRDARLEELWGSAH